MIPRLGIVAGAGPLPQALYDLDGDAVLIRFAGVETQARGQRMVRARLDRLSAFLDDIRSYGVRDLVLAGQMALPVKPGDDVESMRWVARLPDGAASHAQAGLAAFIGWAEGYDYQVLSPQDLAPDLMLPPGMVFGRRATREDRAVAVAGLTALTRLGSNGRATAVVSHRAGVAAIEGTDGLAAMLTALGARAVPEADRGVLAIAAWPGQDLRTQMPALGPDEIDLAADAGLAGVFVAARGVAVVDSDAVSARVAARGLFFEAL